MNVLRALFLAFVFAVRLIAAEEVWRLDNLPKVGGRIATIVGAPRMAEVEGARVALFDGEHDGLFVPVIPFAGAKAYTIEILFQPAEGGPIEQRFLHAQDVGDHRALLETRLDGKGGWWLDTFIFDGRAEPGVTLVDPKRLHATGRWYWAALRYDGKTMAHFVNARKEIERAADFAPFGPGQISIGVRQNKVYWFKGAIREVRFHNEAVADEKLQRVN